MTATAAAIVLAAEEEEDATAAAAAADALQISHTLACTCEHYECTPLLLCPQLCKLDAPNLQSCDLHDLSALFPLFVVASLLVMMNYI